MKHVYKFNQYAAEQSEESLEHQYQMMLKDYKNPKSNVWDQFHSSIVLVKRIGQVRLAGYVYDLRHILKKYLVQHEDGNIQKYYCINKTVLRNIVDSSNKKKLKIADCPANF